jgi:hypothetical protein
MRNAAWSSYLARDWQIQLSSARLAFSSLDLAESLVKEALSAPNRFCQLDSLQKAILESEDVRYRSLPIFAEISL